MILVHNLKIFLIFSIIQICQAGCPFSLRSKRGAESLASEAEILALLKARFNSSIYSKGLDFETRVRDNPTKKNLFGACPSEKCVPTAKFRTFSGYCNNLKSSLSFGGRASRLKRLLVIILMKILLLSIQNYSHKITLIKFKITLISLKITLVFVESGI